MKLDATVLRYLTKNDFRVLVAIEMGQKNHEIVPAVLIETISNVKRANVRKILANLLKWKLIAHDGKKYDGYKLTYNGYDFLALRTFVSRGVITGVGMRMGVGKESDIHICQGEDGRTLCLKLHRLGRISFRTIKDNRDYLNGRSSASWKYMARLACKKEYAYMCALNEAGFRVPKPVDQNRHAIVMEYVQASPLYHVRHLDHPLTVLEKLMRLLVRLAAAGLIHGDFNEFNLMIDEKEKITLIDFPQIIGLHHANAEMYFNRDVTCIREFFRRRFGIQVDEFPVYKEVVQKVAEMDALKEARDARDANNSDSDDEYDMPAKPVHVNVLSAQEENMLTSCISAERFVRNEKPDADESEDESEDENEDEGDCESQAEEEEDLPELVSLEKMSELEQLNAGEFVSVKHLQEEDGEENEPTVLHTTLTARSSKAGVTFEIDEAAENEEDFSESDGETVQKVEVKIKRKVKKVQTRTVASAEAVKAQLQRQRHHAKPNTSKKDRNAKKAQNELRAWMQDY